MNVSLIIIFLSIKNFKGDFNEFFMFFASDETAQHVFCFTREVAKCFSKRSEVFLFVPVFQESPQ